MFCVAKVEQHGGVAVSTVASRLEGPMFES